jgi:hypothetical protein
MFSNFLQIILGFQDDTVAMQKAKKYVDSNTVQAHIAYITSNFKILAESIKQLETMDLPLNNSIQIMEDLKVTLSLASGKVAAILLTKFNEVLNRNPDYLILKEVASVLSGEISQIPIQFGITAANVVNFKFAPCSSCDVERSFSNYKFLLSDKRQSLTSEHMEKILVCYSANLKKK